MCMFCQFSLPLPSSHLIRKCSLCTRYYFVKRLSVVPSNPSVFLLLEPFVKKCGLQWLNLSVFHFCLFPFSGLTCINWSSLRCSHKIETPKSSTLLLDFTMTAFLMLQTHRAGKSGAYWEHFDVVSGRTQSNMELLHSDRLSRSKWIFLEQQQQWRVKDGTQKLRNSERRTQNKLHGNQLQDPVI